MKEAGIRVDSVSWPLALSVTTILSVDLAFRSSFLLASSRFDKALVSLSCRIGTARS